MRKSLLTPGWPTSCIAAATIAASCSRSLSWRAKSSRARIAPSACRVQVQVQGQEECQDRFVWFPQYQFVNCDLAG